MRKELKYTTLLLLVVFLITISMGGYVRIPERYFISTHSYNALTQKGKETSNNYNLYSNTLRDLNVDEDLTSVSTIRWCVREVFQFDDQVVSKQCQVAIQNTQLVPIYTVSNLYYVFALRKITV